MAASVRIGGQRSNIFAHCNRALRLLADLQAVFIEEQHLARRRDVAAIAGIEQFDGRSTKVAHLFLAGSVYFEFMQRTEGRKAYFTGLLRDRDLAQALMQQVMNRSFEEIQRTDIVEDPAYRNDLIMSIGGFFELFYDYLKRGEHFEPTLYYGQMTRVWMLSAGFPGDEIARVIAQCELALEHHSEMTDALERAFSEL